MAQEENDYDPIIRQDTIEKAPGILGRRRVRRSLPDAGHGEELVLIDASGTPLSATTAGERYWGLLRSWVIVDVSDHHLTFRFPYRDTDGAAGYQIEAITTVTLADAAAAVRRKARGVRTYVAPVLESAAAGVLAGRHDDANLDTLSRLNTRLRSHSQQLRGLVGHPLPVGDWLSAVITNITIQFDAGTAAHYDKLVASNRDSELTDTSLINQKQTALHKIALDKTWAEYLTEQVTDPLKAQVAAVAANPTPASIQALADRLDETDRWQRDQLVSTVGTLIDKKVIVELDDLRKAKVMIDGLQKGLAAESADQHQPQEMISDGSQSRPDQTVADAEIVDDDKDWGD